MGRVIIFTDIKKIVLLVLLSAFSWLKCHGQYSFPAQSNIVYPNIQYFYSVPPTCFNYYWSCSNPNILWNTDPYNVTSVCYITWVNPNPYPITAYLYLTAVDYIGGGSGSGGASGSGGGSGSGEDGDGEIGGSGGTGGTGGSGETGGGAAGPAGSPAGPSGSGGSSSGGGGIDDPGGGGPAGAPGGSGGGGGGGDDGGGDGGGGDGDRMASTTVATPTGDCSSYTWAVTIMPNLTGCPSPVNLYPCGDYKYGPINMGATNIVYAGGPSGACSPGVAGAFTIDSGGAINMKAGVKIQLQPGFRVKAGGTFKATIGEPCQDGVDFRQYNSVVNSILTRPVAAANVVNVYPNPTSGIVTINFYYIKKVSAITIKVLDLLGKEVYEQEVEQVQAGEAMINLSDQPAGIYIVQVSSGNNITTQKVVLEK